MAKSPKSKPAHPKAKAAAHAASATEALVPLGEGGELHQQADGIETTLTTNQGVPISDNQNSLKAGPRGPMLLRGLSSCARRSCISTTSASLSASFTPAARPRMDSSSASRLARTYTAADFLQRPGEKTPVFARFSTVAGNSGSADLARDVRGFAVKFYTKEGNFDLVGNNIPVFFIQDAIKFPDLIHAAKHGPRPRASRRRQRRTTRSGTSSR